MVDLYISDETKPKKNQPTPQPKIHAQPESQVSSTSKTQPSSTIDVTEAEPHIMASFHEGPEGIKLANQAPDEEIILFLRRHYITNLPWQIGTVIFVILPLIAFAFIPYLTLPFSISTKYIVISVIFYYLIVFGYAFISFVVWFYNVGIISNKRVIDIDINGISSKDVAATELRDIIDVSYKQSGFQQSLFDYGDVYMETQAEKPNFEFLQIPHPAKVSDMISSLSGHRRL